MFCIVGGNFFPLQLMPKYVQNIAALTPNYWFIKSILYIIYDVESILPLMVMALCLIFTGLNIALTQFSFRRKYNG